MRLTDLPDQPLAADRFRVDTLASGVSLGTETTWYRGTNPALHARWDPELGLFRPGAPAVGWPVRRLGYMQVGTYGA